MTQWVPVYLRCPSCGHVWHEASQPPRTHFCYSPASEIAKRPHCPACGAKPPMLVAAPPSRVESAVGR